MDVHGRLVWLKNEQTVCFPVCSAGRHVHVEEEMW